MFSFKYSQRPNTPALQLDGSIPRRGEGPAADDRAGKAARRSRSGAMRKQSATVQEVLVEGFNKATGQWIGRTSQNKTLNFIRPHGNGGSLAGKYLDVRVTRSGPNSLAGESVN